MIGRKPEYLSGAAAGNSKLICEVFGMKEDKHKRLLRIGCLILAGVLVLSLLASVFMMLLYY